MDPMAGPVARRPHPADSPNMRTVKEAFRAFTEEGVEAGVESLLGHAHEDTEFRPYSAAGHVLRGPGEVRAFFRARLEEGNQITLRPASFEEVGDEVVVHGSLRTVRPTGGFAESQISWTYRFRDGLLEEAHWGPRHRA
jgi:ketosteroid isomerase-like protein